MTKYINVGISFSIRKTKKKRERKFELEIPKIIIVKMNKNYFVALC